jgi:glucosyl-3-phosphoglycerate synthase
VSDLAQAGLICTLQRLNDTHLPVLEAELELQSAIRSIALILPCHAGDLFQPALAHIVEELGRVRFLREVVVSLNGYDEPAFEHAREIFPSLPQRVRVLWNDGPTLAPLLSRWSSAMGKGMNVWSAVGALTGDGGPELIVTQDADVASFRSSTLARLCSACLHPQLGYQFARMYYSRVTDRLYGRVSRLFLTPLLQAFTRVAGHHPLLDFLISFRYPLAGETALTTALAAELPLGQSWSLEIGMLCELFRRADPREICQVDGGTGYDHRHHPLSEGGALAQMAQDIAGALFAQLAQEGLNVTAQLRVSVAAAFRDEAALALRRSRSLAAINGLPFDEATEREIVEALSAELSKPSAAVPSLLPSWATLMQQEPEWVEQFRAAVAHDSTAPRR